MANKPFYDEDILPGDILMWKASDGMYIIWFTIKRVGQTLRFLNLASLEYASDTIRADPRPGKYWTLFRDGKIVNV